MNTINKINLINTKQTNSFKGWNGSIVTSAANAMINNEMVGPIVTDVFGMVGPRTYFETKRNKNSAIETLARESEATVRECVIPGFLAIGVASILNKIINPKINISSAIMANNETVDKLTSVWKKSIGTKEEKALTFSKDILTELTGLNGNKLSKESIDKEAKNIANVLLANINKKELKNIKGRIGQELQIRKIVNVGNLETSVDKLIDDTYSLGKNLFVKNDSILNKAVSKIKSINKSKAAITIGLLSGVGLFFQYFNRLWTKKRTGSDDFVGSKNFGKEKTEEEKKRSTENLGLKKILSLGALSGLSVFGFKVGGPGKLVKKMQFTGLFPNLNQLKVIYIATVIGRILSSKDNNELRETNTRDFTGFANWLILGDVVNKSFISSKDKTLLIKRKPLKEGANILDKTWNLLTQTVIKSHAEVKDSISIIGEKAAKKQIKILNKSAALSFAITAVALGTVVPLINIFTTKCNENKLEKQAVNENLSKANKTIFKDFVK